MGNRLVPGAADAIATLRRSGMPMRFGTNITRMSRILLVEQINGLGIELDAEEVITAPIATASWLEKKGIWNLFLCLPEATYPRFCSLYSRRNITTGSYHWRPRHRVGFRPP